jgi:hypothetical protein
MPRTAAPRQGCVPPYPQIPGQPIPYIGHRQINRNPPHMSTIANLSADALAGPATALPGDSPCQASAALGASLACRAIGQGIGRVIGL